MIVKPHDFTIFVVNHPKVFLFFAVCPVCPVKKASVLPTFLCFQVKFLAETLNFSLFTLDIHGGITDVGNSELGVGFGGEEAVVRH